MADQREAWRYSPAIAPLVRPPGDPLLVDGPQTMYPDYTQSPGGASLPGFSLPEINMPPPNYTPIDPARPNNWTNLWGFLAPGAPPARTGTGAEVERAPHQNTFDPAATQAPMPEFGGAGTEMFTPEQFGYRADRAVDPSLAARETYATERSGRIAELVQAYMDRAQENNQWSRPAWQRVLAMIPALAGAPVGRVGQAGAEVLSDWNAQDADLQERMLRMSLGLEDERGRAAEAGFDRISGEHSTREGNIDARYGVDNQNVSVRNAAGQQNVSERNATARATAGQAFQARLAAWQADREERNLARQLVLPGGGEGAFNAYGNMISSAGENVRQPALETQARRGLERVIENTLALAGDNKGRRRSQVHAEMERIAGTTLPRPPAFNDQTTPQSLARYYIQQGVPLDNPEVLADFPGFAPAE